MFHAIVLPPDFRHCRLLRLPLPPPDVYCRHDVFFRRRACQRCFSLLRCYFSAWPATPPTDAMPPPMFASRCSPPCRLPSSPPSAVAVTFCVSPPPSPIISSRRFTSRCRNAAAACFLHRCQLMSLSLFSPGRQFRYFRQLLPGHASPPDNAATRLLRSFRQPSVQISRLSSRCRRRVCRRRRRDAASAAAAAPKIDEPPPPPPFLMLPPP